MGERYVFTILSVVFAFLASGLGFAAVRSRRTGEPYLLFWRNPLSPKGHALAKNMYFRGTLAEVSRVGLLGIVAILFAWEALK